MAAHLSRVAMAAAACAMPLVAYAAVYDGKGDLVVPAFAELAPRGGVVTEFTVKINCAGVRSLDNIPDGWSAELRPEGESYLVHVARAHAQTWPGKLAEADRVESNRRLEAVRIRLIRRGRWSDCLGVHASFTVRRPGGPEGLWMAEEVRLAETSVVDKDSNVVDTHWVPDRDSPRK